MTIAIIGALPIELKKIKLHYSLNLKNESNIYKIHTYTNNIFKIIFSESGIGKISAASCTQHIIDKYKPNLIINIGLCGALMESLSIGQVIFSNSFIQYDFSLNLEGKKTNWSPIYQSELLTTNIPKELESFLCDYIIASGDKFISSVNQKKILLDLGAHICDMESISVAQTAFLNQIQCISVRGISDHANTSTPPKREDIETAIDRYTIAVIEIINFLLNQRIGHH